MPWIPKGAGNDGSKLRPLDLQIPTLTTTPKGIPTNPRDRNIVQRAPRPAYPYLKFSAIPRPSIVNFLAEKKSSNGRFSLTFVFLWGQFVEVGILDVDNLYKYAWVVSFYRRSKSIPTPGASIAAVRCSLTRYVTRWQQVPAGTSGAAWGPIATK